MKRHFINPKTCSGVFAVILGASAFGFLAPCGQAQTVAEHVGLNNPTNDAWAFAAGTTTTPPPDSLTGGNDGENYWRIKQVNDASGYYSHVLVSSNLTDPSGWTAT